MDWTFMGEFKLLHCNENVSLIWSCSQDWQHCTALVIGTSLARSGLIFCVANWSNFLCFQSIRNSKWADLLLDWSSFFWSGSTNSGRDLFATHLIFYFVSFLTWEFWYCRQFFFIKWCCATLFSSFLVFCSRSYVWFLFSQCFSLLLYCLCILFYIRQ